MIKEMKIKTKMRYLVIHLLLGAPWLVIFPVGEHMEGKDSHPLLVSMQIGSAFVRAIWHTLLSQISIAALAYNLEQTASVPDFISYFCVCFLLDGDIWASHLSPVA